jgi:hypothetical protein
LDFPWSLGARIVHTRPSNTFEKFKLSLQSIMGWFEQAPANKVSRDHRKNGCLPSECRGWGKTSTLARAGQSSAFTWELSPPLPDDAIIQPPRCS